MSISIHALRVEGDSSQSRCTCRGHHFYPRPPGGGRPSSNAFTSASVDFYPRPPGGGRRILGRWANNRLQFLSTPSGWRATVFALCSGISVQPKFLSTPSGWRATFADAVRVGGHDRFLSTPSGWRATIFHLSIPRVDAISIHALRVEGDVGFIKRAHNVKISIHALRVEGDREKGLPLLRL